MLIWRGVLYSIQFYVIKFAEIGAIVSYVSFHPVVLKKILNFSTNQKLWQPR